MGARVRVDHDFHTARPLISFHSSAGGSPAPAFLGYPQDQIIHIVPPWRSKGRKLQHYPAAPEPRVSARQEIMQLPGQSQRGKEAMRIFRFSTASLGLPGVRSCPAAPGRTSDLCAWSSTVIRVHAGQSRFTPDGECTSAPSPHTGQ